MSTLLDNFTTPTAAEQLQNVSAAVRVSFQWFGIRKTLTADQKAQAADTFGAEEQFLSAGKKLIDTKHPAWQELTRTRNRIQTYWRSVTLPYPEPGVRLIRQEQVEAFNAQMADFRRELDAAVRQLDNRFTELKAAARNRLGSLYNSADYPATLDGLFQVDWDFPSIQPPDYLLQLSPELYEQECRRMRSRFDEAVRLAEEAFTAELARLVSHLTERLAAGEDGKPKIFRDSAVNGLQEFFERFRELNIGSSQQLDRLVDNVQQIVAGVAPSKLRGNAPLRQHVATELSRVQATLDGLLVARPRRKILRPGQ